MRVLTASDTMALFVCVCHGLWVASGSALAVALDQVTASVDEGGAPSASE